MVLGHQLTIRPRLDLCDDYKQFDLTQACRQTCTPCLLCPFCPFLVVRRRAGKSAHCVCIVVVLHLHHLARLVSTEAIQSMQWHHIFYIHGGLNPCSFTGKLTPNSAAVTSRCTPAHTTAPFRKGRRLEGKKLLFALSTSDLDLETHRCGGQCCVRGFQAAGLHSVTDPSECSSLTILCPGWGVGAACLHSKTVQLQCTHTPTPHASCMPCTGWGVGAV